MENNKEFNKEKFDSLYQEVFNEISNEFEFKESVNKFRKTQFSYLSNLDKFFHKKCPKEFEWIEKNSTFVNGQMKPKENVDNKGIATVDLSKLAPGTYSLKIETSDETFTQTIVKQ